MDSPERMIKSPGGVDSSEGGSSSRTGLVARFAISCSVDIPTDPMYERSRGEL